MRQLNSQQIQMLSRGTLPSINRFLLGLLSDRFITGQVELRTYQQIYAPIEACLTQITIQIKSALQ